MTERAKQGALFTPDELVQLHGESIEELRSSLGRVLERVARLEQHVVELPLAQRVDALEREVSTLDPGWAPTGATRARPRPGTLYYPVSGAELEDLVDRWRRRALSCSTGGRRVLVDLCADELAELLEGHE